MKKVQTIIVILFLAICSYGQQDMAGNVLCKYFESKIEVKICDAFKKLKDYHEYVEYAEGVANDVVNKKTPRDSPTKLTGGDAILQTLTSIENDIVKINIPTVIKSDLPYPSLESLSSTDFDIRRESVNMAVSHIFSYSDELKNFRNLKDYLSVFKKEADEVNGELNELDKIMDVAFEITGSGYSEISTTIGMKWLNIKTKVRRKVSDIRSALNTKIQTIDELLLKEKKSLDNLQNNTILIVVAEKEALEIEQISLDNDKKAMKLEAKALEIKFEENQAYGEKLYEIENDFKSRKKILVSQLDKLDALIIKYNSNIEKLKEKELSINRMKYTGCPKGKSFDDCTEHINNKKLFVDKRNTAVREYEALAAITEEQYEMNKAFEDDFIGKKNIYDAKYSKFEEDAVKWKQSRQELKEKDSNLVKIAKELGVKTNDNKALIEENKLDMKKIRNITVLGAN